MEKVELHLYDLSKGISKVVSKPVTGRKFEGIWHTTIVVFGLEYFFGTGGITVIDRSIDIPKPPDNIIDLGVTNKTKSEFESFLTDLEKDEFDGSKYNLLKHNCNSFTDRASLYLTGQHIPEDIRKLPEDVLSTPVASYAMTMLKGINHGVTLGKLVTVAAAGKVAAKIVTLPIEKTLLATVIAGEESSEILKKKILQKHGKKAKNSGSSPTAPPNSPSVFDSNDINIDNQSE